MEGKKRAATRLAEELLQVGGQGVWCGGAGLWYEELLQVGGWAGRVVRLCMGAAASAWVGRACGAVGLWYEALLQVGGYVRVCGVGLVCWYVNGKRSDQNSKTLASWYEAQSYMLFQAAVNTPAPALNLPAACPTQPRRRRRRSWARRRLCWRRGWRRGSRRWLPP